MPGPAQSGVFIYAKDIDRVSRFYEGVLGLSRRHASAELVVLQGQDAQLIVHATPPEIAAAIRITSPPEPRENVALKFFFTVSSIAAARADAAALGGAVFSQQYDGPGFRVCNAFDPEGNIFQVREPCA